MYHKQWVEIPSYESNRQNTRHLSYLEEARVKQSTIALQKLGGYALDLFKSSFLPVTLLRHLPEPLTGPTLAMQTARGSQLPPQLASALKKVLASRLPL